MTGNDNGYSVIAIGSGNRSYGYGIADDFSLFFIQPSFAVWNRLQSWPDFLLKSCPGDDQWNGKFFSFLGFLAVQVGRQNIPIVLTPTKNRPSKLLSLSNSAWYMVVSSGNEWFMIWGSGSIISDSLKFFHCLNIAFFLKWWNRKFNNFIGFIKFFL